MEAIYHYLPWLIWHLGVFVLGACVGSLLNVVIGRLPAEKSILWPSSRCLNCLVPIRTRDNLPILAWFILRGRCRTCGQHFSSRYMWIELLTALAFLGLFHLEMYRNVHDIPAIRADTWAIQVGAIPLSLWFYFIPHAVLMSFLIAASVCDLDGKVIPLTITIPGTIVGLVFSTLLPWPWPNPVEIAGQIPAGKPWFLLEVAGRIPPGYHLWPVWGPLPEWLPPGSPQLGFVTGLTGAVVGSGMMRVVRFTFGKGLGVEAMGLGDADLMMMAGAFLGWQIVVLGFFIGAVVALVLMIPALIRGFSGTLPFGPGLSLGAMLTWFAWPSIGPQLQPFLFDEVSMILLALILTFGMFFFSLLLRRRHSEDR